MRKKRFKVLLSLAVFFYTGWVLGQKEYAYMVETKITGYLHANNNSLSIGTDKGSVGGTNYMATFSTQGKTYYDFFYLQDDFNKVTINVNNYAIRLRTFPDCTYERKREINRADFGNLYLNFSGCSFSQQLYSLHTYDDENAKNNGVCLDNSVTLKFGYHWRYKLEGGSWTDFPAEYNNRIITTFNFKDLLAKTGVDVDNLSAKTVKFQTGFNNQYTNIVTYSIIACAPKLVEDPSVKNTTCYYDSDGKFSLKVDRDLVNNERLLVSIFFESAPNIYSFYKQAESSSLQSDGLGNFIYNYEGNLAPGNYKVKYQGYLGTGMIDKDDPSWTQLAFSNPFTIGTPTNVSFSIVNTANESCFKANNGYIDIHADGEDGRTYLYQLKKDGIVQFFNGTSWVNYTGSNEKTETWFAFTNGKNTRVSKLNKGKYQIKVKDSQECFAR
ncbi:hypothetical protein [uncultured Tenacibaculum sp.]|uniref:hypothetical protein n=1 Tax=uncultured Tenacibaculum sp. TaxID=174713 RepID=UPI00261B7038|nr:hypothetical protein [uncultured Tenacibaculum sp.]